MDDNDKWHRMLQGLVDGDDLVYAAFWDCYGKRLEGVARRHLPKGMHRRVDPEDLVQSACRTFFRRVSVGKLTATDGEALWRLICAITLNKVRMHIRYNMRQRRAMDREQHDGSPNQESSRGSPVEPRSREPLPDEAAMFAEQLTGIMADLNKEECQLVQLKMDQCTNDEIAAQMDISERTVRRILKRVRSRLWDTLRDSSPTIRDPNPEK